MSNSLLISPSIIASDLTAMAGIVGTFDPAVVDLLHMDVMDGNFVPNITFGPGYIANLKQHSPIPLDIHLMIERPESSIDRYLDLEPWAVTIHYESTRFPARLCSVIRERGVKAGISINPATPIRTLFDILPYCDMVLVMSVDPGFYGQAFMKEAVPRISRLNKQIISESLDVLIQVDGGINLDNIARVVEAGATVVVAGNSAFKGGDVNGNVAALKKAARAS